MVRWLRCWILITDCLGLKIGFDMKKLCDLSKRAIVTLFMVCRGFPGGASGKERRRGFDPWIRKIPWRRKWQPTPVFLPGKSHRQRKCGRLQSIASYRVGYDWRDLTCTYTWSIKWGYNSTYLIGLLWWLHVKQIQSCILHIIYIVSLVYYCYQCMHKVACEDTLLWEMRLIVLGAAEWW